MRLKHRQRVRAQHLHVNRTSSIIVAISDGDFSVSPSGHGHGHSVQSAVEHSVRFAAVMLDEYESPGLVIYSLIVGLAWVSKHHRPKGMTDREAIDDIVERILDWLSAKDQPAADSNPYPFHLRDDFLSPAEANFFQVLRLVTGQQVVALAKVNLNDLFFAQTGDARRNRAVSNRIDRKHVDFLLCDSSTLRPVLGIELDDGSHQQPERAARDELVDGVFSAAGLPLLRVPVRRSYSADELVALIQPCFGPASTPASSPPVPSESQTTTEQTPSCPKCGAVMALRTAKTGANAGGQFWGCTSYPRCRTTLPV